VLRDHVGDELAVLGKVEGDAAPAWESFAFRIEVPAALAANLESHNGDIEVRGLAGEIAVVSHNGRIAIEAAAPRVRATSHNGGLALDLRGAGPVDATLETHNGEVDLRLGERTAAIEAETHNGGFEATGLEDQVVTERTLRGKRGSGGGMVRIATHNGGIRIR
jgi:DUF4097 and DUF4098 domain-containing protein YvlB